MFWRLGPQLQSLGSACPGRSTGKSRGRGVRRMWFQAWHCASTTEKDSHFPTRPQLSSCRQKRLAQLSCKASFILKALQYINPIWDSMRSFVQWSLVGAA